MSIRHSLRVLRRGPTFAAPLRTAARHKPTLLGKLALERWVFVSNSVDHRLKTLVELRAASMIGCVW